MNSFTAGIDLFVSTCTTVEYCFAFHNIFKSYTHSCISPSAVKKQHHSVCVHAEKLSSLWHRGNLNHLMHEIICTRAREILRRVCLHAQKTAPADCCNMCVWKKASEREHATWTDIYMNERECLYMGVQYL
jgi:hypothetical protein